MQEFNDLGDEFRITVHYVLTNEYNLSLNRKMESFFQKKIEHFWKFWFSKNLEKSKISISISDCSIWRISIFWRLWAVFIMFVSQERVRGLILIQILEERLIQQE